MSSLQLQAKIIAIVEIITATICIFLLSLMGITITIKRNTLIDAMNQHPNETDHEELRKLLDAPLLEQLSLFIIPICYFLGELILAILLFRSVNQLNHKRLRLWFIVTGTLLGVGLLIFLTELLRSDDFLQVTFTITAITTLFTGYSMTIVYLLIGEIKAGGERHPVPYHNGFYKL